MAILKGVQKKNLVLNFGCAHISASIHRIFKILCLPHIIGGVLWGVGTRILKIRCIEAEI